MTTYNYSPATENLIINGAPIRGWNGITVNLPNKRNSMDHDASGDGVFIENSSYRYFEMTINVSQQSEANDILSVLYADNTTCGLLLKSTTGRTVFASGKVKINLNSFGRAKDAVTDTEWEGIGNYDVCFPGGNIEA